MVAFQLDAAAWAELRPVALLGAGSRMVQRRDMCLVPTQKIRLNNMIHFS
jgi:hypothetical protein